MRPSLPKSCSFFFFFFLILYPSRVLFTPPKDKQNDHCFLLNPMADYIYRREWAAMLLPSIEGIIMSAPITHNNICPKITWTGRGYAKRTLNKLITVCDISYIWLIYTAANKSKLFWGNWKMKQFSPRLLKIWKSNCFFHQNSERQEISTNNQPW